MMAVTVEMVFPGKKEFDLVGVQEVMDKLHVGKTKVYDLFDSGVLEGPRDLPRRVFAGSVVAYLNNRNTPAQAPTEEPEPAAASPVKTRPARPPKGRVGRILAELPRTAPTTPST